MSPSDPNDVPSLPGIVLQVTEDISPPATGFLRILRRRYQASYPDGSQSEPFVYDTIDRAALDAVVIIAHYASAEGRFVYLRSAIRPPVASRDPSLRPALPANPNGALWELPAGLVEPEERGDTGPAESARRELAEELGFHVSVARMRPLGPSTYPAPGMIGERHFFFEVEVDPSTRQEPGCDGSPLERFGRVVSVRLDAALELCRSGAIDDAKTELGLRRLVEKIE
jgi:ADP-ribose pyrophosphatase